MAVMIISCLRNGNAAHLGDVLACEVSVSRCVGPSCDVCSSAVFRALRFHGIMHAAPCNTQLHSARGGSAGTGMLT